MCQRHWSGGRVLAGDEQVREMVIVLGAKGEGYIDVAAIVWIVGGNDDEGGR